nr:multidrug resistance-associated protein 4-like [Leptinotarsa decemlineata]
MEGVKYSSVKTKNLHPMFQGSLLSRLFFWWLPLFLWKGLKKEIEEDDIYETEKSQESALLGGQLEMAWKKELNKENPSLARALFRVFGGELAIFALYHIFAEGVKVSQPILIFHMLSLLQDKNPGEDNGKIFTYVAFVALVAFLRAASTHNYQMSITFLGMKVRIAVCSLIYRKSLRLSKSALAETTIGQMVNLLTNDVGRFDTVAQYFHYLWCTPFLILVEAYFLFIYVGPSGIVGNAYLVGFIPVQMFLAKLVSKYRLRTATRTDERVRLMNEIVSGIQVIKMYTWEKQFSKLAEIIRRQEIQQIRQTFTIRAFTNCYSIVSLKIAVFISILTHVLTGNTLTAKYTYTVLVFYGVLRSSLLTFFTQGLTFFAEAKVSVKRIQQFLLYEELMETDVTDHNSFSNDPKPFANFKEGDIGICIENLSAKWVKKLPENILQGVNFHVVSNQLVAIVGPVGGGKTTLLNVILKELTPTEGSVEVKGTISYASQEPWVFGASVRQNILFGQDYDPKKYDEVIRVCALQSDFAQFNHGDRTLVGERGVTLSGGQRARINLARAVYKEADIYLLDDPLSAVDAQVGKQLFEECICGYLKTKCVILITHQLQYLKNADYIYLLKDGRIHSSGTFNELKISDCDFTTLLEELKEVEEKEEVPTESRVEKEYEVDDEKSPMIHQKEKKASGKVTWHVYESYFRAGGGWCRIFILLLGYTIGQMFNSVTDYFLSIWVNVEQMRLKQKNDTFNSASIIVDSSSNSTTQYEATKIISFRSGHWLKPILTPDNTVIIYTSLILATVIVTVLIRILFFRSSLNASTRLHNRMFSNILNSTMRFFNTNPSGRILNRFSKDIGIIDEGIPVTFGETISIGFSMVATCLMIAILNPWIMIPSLIILLIFYFMRKAFLVSSRNIKRIESNTRSPVYTHLAASLQGLTTIRAFGAEKVISEEFDRFQDSYTSAYVMFTSATRGFGFWLDFHCSIYIFLVMVSILFIENESYSGNIGLSITQAISLTGIFQHFLRQWSEFVNQMTSVERIQEYADIIPEQDIITKSPPKSWPDRGRIDFVNVYMKYSKNTPYILKNLVFGIRPIEKIGIVGRTGAGKSSLIQALFRLVDIEGSILIDDIDTKSVPLNVLRSKISIIPQEPVLFSGTLRMNLDPFDDYDDEILWDALEQVELKKLVNEFPEGLDSKVSEGGSNFSVGQRQLICLARAIVRQNKILVLDEATANVDPQTDALVQNTIRQKFSSCTVLTIAHRLHSIMDSDKVLVMDGGEAVEFDHPFVLLQMNKGVFHELVNQTGASMAQNLYAIAEEKFSRKK